MKVGLRIVFFGQDFLILFFGLNPAFSMSLKNSISPRIDNPRNKMATENLFQRIAPISTDTKIRPVKDLLTNSFTCLKLT